MVRKWTGLTQKDFAEKLGVKQGYISRIERGLSVPSNQLLRAISAIYEVDETWLRTGSGPLIIASKRAWADMVEKLPIRKDPINEGLRLLLEAYSEALVRMNKMLSVYKYGRKITDEVRPDVLEARKEMLKLIGRLRFTTDTLMECEREVVTFIKDPEKTKSE
jgi:transcriptional regulator with XRE-family HTH domain